MINVRRLANFATQNVNPNRTVTLEVSTGFTVDEYGVQVPQFLSEQIEVQPQSLESTEKYNLGLINRQGEFMSLYVFGDINGIRRWLAKGASRFIFPAYGEEDPAIWNVDQVAESFATWTRVIVWRADQAPAPVGGE